MLMFLTACQSSDVGAPVRNAGESGKYHRVQKGDTLYSIAWRYGKDYKSLAKANKIAYPYTIYLGQKLVIRGRSAQSASKPVARKKTSKSKSTAKSSAAKSSSKATTSTINWSWPLNGKVIKEERLLDGLGRVRSIEQGPDGYIYVGIENLGIVKLLKTI